MLEGSEGQIAVNHFYRALSWHAEELQAGSAPTVREIVFDKLAGRAGPQTLYFEFFSRDPLAVTRMEALRSVSQLHGVSSRAKLTSRTYTVATAQVAQGELDVPAGPILLVTYETQTLARGRHSPTETLRAVTDRRPSPVIDGTSLPDRIRSVMDDVDAGCAERAKCRRPPVPDRSLAVLQGPLRPRSCGSGRREDRDPPGGGSASTVTGRACLRHAVHAAPGAGALAIRLVAQRQRLHRLSLGRERGARWAGGVPPPSLPARHPFCGPAHCNHEEALRIRSRGGEPRGREMERPPMPSD